MSIATENRVRFSRVWEMPNHRTFSIPCVDRIINKYIKPEMFSIDPFSNKSRFASVTNDIDGDHEADHKLDAVDFLDLYRKDQVDAVLFDPPYSSRQVSECYKRMGKTVDTKTTQSSFWTVMKRKVSNIVKPGGIVISFGWNSNGIGQELGFELLEILLVAHGGAHNDTIVTVERKIQSKLF